MQMLNKYDNSKQDINLFIAVVQYQWLDALAHAATAFGALNKLCKQIIVFSGYLSLFVH